MKEERKEKELRQKWSLALSMIENIINRHEKIIDPVTRHLLFTDKLCLIIDICMGAMASAIIIHNLSDDIIKRTEIIGHKVEKQIQELMEWIQNRIYSPDYPFGQNMMQSTAKHFKGNV